VTSKSIVYYIIQGREKHNAEKRRAKEQRHGVSFNWSLAPTIKIAGYEKQKLTNEAKENNLVIVGETPWGLPKNRYQIKYLTCIRGLMRVPSVDFFAFCSL
jgi:hypothetical protein